MRIIKIKDSKSYIYCQWCVEKDNDYVGIYIKKQAQEWINIVDGNNLDATIDEKMFDKVCGILKLMVHPDLQCSIYDGLERYQWFFIIAILCTVNRTNNYRYYETGLLEISRKNYKTFCSGIIFIIGMLLEPQFSRFFSVAPDYSLSCELKLAVKKIIKSSPLLIDRFKINRDLILCKLTDTEYIPLAFSNDGMDGKLANIYLADEAGLLPDYPVEAMRSSQITLKNKLGIIISTQYPNTVNVMVTEVDYAKKVLDGFIDNKRYFSLLYEPNEEIKKEWETNDLVIYQSNPVAIDNILIFKSITDKRVMAILYETKRENYLCKHNNILYKGLGVEGYVSSEQIKACKIDYEFDWTGREVYIGLDLAETWDNTGVSMITYLEDEEKVMCKTWAIIPKDLIDIKSKRERVDYRLAIEDGNCLACGELVVDYKFIEDSVMSIQEKYGVEILEIGYDIRNARASAQRLEDEGYNLVEVKQHSSVLHSSTKWMKELILKQKFMYEDNQLLEMNFTNCRQTEDTNLNKYLNKKKSEGKIDLIFATMDAMYLLEQEILLNSGGCAVQT